MIYSESWITSRKSQAQGWIMFSLTAYKNVNNIEKCNSCRYNSKVKVDVTWFSNMQPQTKKKAIVISS